MKISCLIKNNTIFKKKEIVIKEIQNFVIIENDKHIIRTCVYYNKGKRSCVKIHDFVLEEVKNVKD